jgi:hypothetical protein
MSTNKLMDKCNPMAGEGAEIEGSPWMDNYKLMDKWREGTDNKLMYK